MKGDQDDGGARFLLGCRKPAGADPQELRERFQVDRDELGSGGMRFRFLHAEKGTAA
jgi:hypothetical protein